MRHLLLLFFVAVPLAAEMTRYQVRPVYSNVGFSIVKWGVLKEEGQFREFNGTLEFDPGDLTIHGVPKRVRFAVVSHGVREVPNVGKAAGFETTFTINRRDFGVLGARWGALPGVLSDDAQLHIVIGATQK